MIKTKLLSRTLRSLFITRPYFAHLSVTQRCNLRCKYCQIWKEPVEELDTAKTKKIIDRLDEMGVAMLSITGGEPLLRDDIGEIINYANRRGLYVRLTSNGMLPLAKYKDLLKTKIDGISISLDGVKGIDTPYSKINPKILKTIKYIYENKGKITLSISSVLHKGNQTEIESIISYVDKHFPGTGVFVQPIVVGTGTLRTNSQNKVDSKILYKLKTMDPDFFIKACQDYYKNDRFDWGCKAGKLFFDIKPNGDFHICQDFPTKLNILSDDFIERWQKSNFQKQIDKCSGCTYSCYYLTQESLRPKNWLGMLSMVSKYRKNLKK